MYNNYLIILYKMKVYVVKNHVEIVIPGVNINADDEDADAKAEAAVKKYLEENNLKKSGSIKATHGFDSSKDRYTIQVVDKPVKSASASASAKSTKKGGKRSKKNNRKRSRHTRR
jgi:hypothetical protein